ncbi:MAG: IclR family transcriptional regulator C-terminal domain-containing protein [Pseudomonadota bacterium]
MNKFARMIDVLDLYSETDTLLTAEEIASRLQVSRPTAFRYARELTIAGFLANYSGRYSLGARIITLDSRIRQSDPVLKAARPVMKDLSAETGCNSVLCRMYNDEVINVHDEAGYDDPYVNFSGRGRPLPLFRGSASTVMVANLPTSRQKKMYLQHGKDRDVLARGQDWPAFRSFYEKVRKTGHYVSHQEIESNTIGIGAPINVAHVGTVATISLVFSADRLALLNEEGLAAVLKSGCADIASELGALTETRPPLPSHPGEPAPK